MILQERHDQIINILDKYKTISVEELARKVYASPSTIRRDLIVLEEQGLLKRVRGGAVSMGGSNFDSPAYLRITQNRAEKEKIANLAMRYIHNFSTYFFDSSSTCCVLAQQLSRTSGVTIATNGLELLYVLKRNSGVRLISLGGEIRKNYDEFTGFMTLNHISQYYADAFFFSCCGLSSQAGATEINDANVAVKHQFRKNAKKSILLCDSSKFGQEFFYKSVDLSEVDYVITDKMPSDKQLLELLKGKIICAEQ